MEFMQMQKQVHDNVEKQQNAFKKPVKLDIPKPEVPLLDVSVPAVDANSIAINIPEMKTVGDKKYEELVAKKAKKDKKNKGQPDEVMGRQSAEVEVTLKDMKKLGVDVNRDLQGLLRNMGKDGERLIPAGGFPDENTVISKELAVRLINYSEAKKSLAKNHSKSR